MLCDDPESLEFLMKFVGNLQKDEHLDLDKTKLRDLIDMLKSCCFPSDKENLQKFVQSLDAYEAEQLLDAAEAELGSDSKSGILISELRRKGQPTQHKDRNQNEIQLPPMDYARVLVNLVEDFESDMEDGTEATDELCNQVIDYLADIPEATRK